MKESILNLIQNIAAGSTLDIEDNFNHIMNHKIASKLDDMRQTVASNMFGTQVVEEGYANPGTKVLGAFREKEHGHHFEYSAAEPDSWGAKHGFPHVVHVGGIDNKEKRFAKVKGTVAHIASDEDEHGKPVVDKWSIKGHRKYTNESFVELSEEELLELDETHQVMFKMKKSDPKISVAHYDSHEAAQNFIKDVESKGGKAMLRKPKSTNESFVELSEEELLELDEEQLDELSKSTLGSYVKKATSPNHPSSITSAGARADMHFNAGNIDKGIKDVELQNKREKGINKAVDKLTK